MPVDLTVLTTEPAIQVSPPSLSSTLAPNSQQVQQLSVSNGGGSDLTFTSAVFLATPVTTTTVFLTLSPDAGSVPPAGTLLG